MDSILTTFLLFLAALTALLTYLVIPSLPIVTLAVGAAVALSAGLWWHWTQFSIDYRTSTWQEQLRSYASYVILFIFFLAVYIFYAFSWTGSSVQAYASAIRNSGRKASSNLLSSASNSLRSAKNLVSAPNMADDEDDEDDSVLI
jgi:O-antigen/teichoic acid export membrane protein